MSVKVKDVLDALQQMQKSLECSICLELLKDPHSTKCNHQFCGQCIRQVLEKSSKKSKNKCYCPLCKTPVSKRSLTPNPKLNEIVAAVRNLQGAVQDDTGIPTGSPPSQPLKVPNTDVNSSVVSFSVPQPTPRKNATGRKGRRKASRDQFTVYIEKKENFGHALESQPPQIVSNVNISSSLRPLPVTQTQTKAKKSAKIETTRKTRNSRRIQEQKSLPEDTDLGRNSNDDLLHLIDTMTFKPVPTEGSSKDFILDPKTEEKLTPSDNSSPSTITLSTLKEVAGEKDDCKLNPSMQKEKPVCLTTIAEADSSISINPCSSTGLFGDKNLVNCENTANPKENVVADTSSKIANSTLLCIPQSTSLDTMQSVSILQSLEDQPHDSAGGFCNESVVENNQQNDVTTYQGDETDELLANEKCDVENREEMYDETRGKASIHDVDEANFKRRSEENKQILGSIAYTETYEKVRDVLPNSIPAKIPEIENHCIEGNNLSSTVICGSAIQEKPAGNYEERETHDKRLSQPSDTILPTENVKTSAEQSLDFEGLVSLFGEPSYSTSQDAMHKEETAQNSTRLDKAAEQWQHAQTLDKETNLGQSLEAVQQVQTVNNISSCSKPKGKKTSPRQKGRGLANLQDSEDSDDSSDLCERVKQRQTRGTSKMLLTESPTTSLTTESKSKKRTVDSMTSFKTRSESSLEGSAKKKFKTSEVPSPSQLSSEKPNTARKQTPRTSEVSSKQKQTEDLVATDCNERSQSHQSEMVNYSCSTDNSIDSNEIIPASVSSSENSKSAVIDPMDVYADQTHEEKKEVASQRKESLKLHKIKERGIFVEDYSSDLKTAEVRSQEERQHSTVPQVKNAVDHDESTQGFTPSPKLSFLSQNLKDSTSGQSLINELKTSHLAESLPCDQSQKASFNVTEQRSQLYEEDFVDQERLVTGKDRTAYDEDTHVPRKTLRTPQCSSGINSLKGKETGDTKNDTKEKGEYSSQLAENGSKTCKPLSQEGCTLSGTPTQCSLEADDFTPCLFGNNSCETPAKIVSQKRTKRVESPLQEGVEEHNGGVNDAEIEEIGVVNDSETLGVTGLLSGSQKGASLKTCSDGTQSFGTSQSISVLHDLDVPSQGQQEGTDRRDDPSEPAFHAEHSNKETESDKEWAEPLPKKPRCKQQPDSKGMELNMSNCHGKKKTNGSELTESEIIPPTPPVKTVTKHVFDVHAQSPLKLTSPKRNVQMNETSKATCHSKSLTVKRKRSIRSPRCSNSPKLQENTDDGTAMHVSSSFSRGSEVNVSVFENHDRTSMNADIKGSSQAMEFEVGTSASSEQQLVNLSQETNTETLVHGSKINANKAAKRLRRLDNIQKQGTYCESISPRVLDGPRLSQSEANSEVSKYDNVGREDLRDSPSAEVESIHSSPCSPVKRRLANIGDSFDWSGTRTVQKRDGYSQDSPVALNNCDNNAEHFRGKEVEDCYVDQLNSPNTSQARDETEDSSEDFLRKSEAKGELSNPFVGNIRVRNSCSVVDEEISLTDAEEEDSSGDESLLKPAFLPKESRKSPESQIDNTHDSDDEEEEVTVFSQELIPSENEDDDDDGASYKALDSTGASTSTFLSEAAASTQRMDVLRQDVEAMEKEMEELRAYLAKTDENREDEEHTLKDDDINYQEADLVDDRDIQPSLTPPPPLTPKSIPPMPQLSTPLKNFSRYLEQEGQSSDEGSECEDATISEPVKRTELPRRFGYQGNRSTTERLSPGEKSGKKRPLSPSDDDDDGLRITEVEHRQEETPSPRSNHSMERSQEKDEDKLIVIDDRNSPESRNGSLLLVKRRKLTHDLMPKKSPVVSLLFTRAGKGLGKSNQSPGTRSKGSSPTMKKSSSSIYLRKPGTSISPIRGQSPTKTGSLKGVSRDNLSKKDSSHNGVSRDDASTTSVSHSNVAREKLSHERSHSPDLVLTNVKKVTSKKSLDNKREDRTTDRQLSFVATRLNRQQLAEARTLAEMYGGKLASEFNSRTSHVIMTTDENMQVTRHSYTMKYLLGLALGKWIVSHRWIAACNQAKSLVSEVDYEVKGDAGLGQASIPRVARTARSNKEALLFEDYEVLCLGEFSAAVTKEQLSQLLRFCGASVFIDAESMKRTEKGRQRVVTIDKETRDNAKELKAISRQLNKKPVSLEWVTDSIANYKIQDLKDYIVEL